MTKIVMPIIGQPPQSTERPLKKYMLYGHRGWQEGRWHPDHGVWARPTTVNYDGYPEDGWALVYEHEEIIAYMEAGVTV